MLKSKQYAKWGKEKDDPDWGNLKATEDERRASLRDMKVRTSLLGLFCFYPCVLQPVFNLIWFDLV